MVRTALTVLVHLLAVPVLPEAVDVDRSGPTELTTFECRDITRSSILQRVCYDREQRRLLVEIASRYDQYCDVPPDLFEALMSAPSMGQFFNRNIRANTSHGRLDCPRHKPI